MGCCMSTKSKPQPDKDIPAGRLFVGFKKEFKNPNFFKEIEVPGSGGKSVLVAKVDGVYCATGSVCPHLGAPLGRGVFRLGRIRCPWHGACFDLSTGELEDYPGYDNLPMYHTTVRNECVFVHVDGDKMPERYIKPVGFLTDKHSKVIILGCGAAGYTCAQTLRQEGFGGRIIMITKEKYFPYDRSLLTKFPGADFKHLKIRSASFYQDHDIEVLVNTRVTKVDMHDHKVYWQGQTRGQELEFDAILLCVGLKPRVYSSNVFGCKLKNICSMFTIDDGQKIMSKARGADVVLVGSSFVAMELAESLSRVAKHVHILSRGKAPFGIVLGETTGKAILQYFLTQVNNVTFYCTDDIYSFQGNKQDEVIQVTTMKKRVIPTTLVIVAIGSLPNTDIFRGTPLRLHPIDHSILVNKFMETNIATIFAAGDCCNFPLYVGARDRANIAHWHVACTHGKVAALNMLGKNISIMDLIPYFWTNILGLSIRYIGHGESYDEALIYGSLEFACFCTVYRRRSKFIGACCVGCEPLATELVVSLEIRENWTKDLPEPIMNRFPGKPYHAEVFHGFKLKDDMHTRDHDMNQYDVIPRVIADRKMAKEHKSQMYRRLGVHEDEDNVFRDPTRPTMELKMAQLRRDQTDAYQRENSKQRRYERMSRVYINNPDLNDIDLLEVGLGSPPIYDIDDGKEPRRYQEQPFDKTLPFSMRYLDQSNIRKELKVIKSQKLARRPLQFDLIGKPVNEPDPYLMVDKILHPKHYQAVRIKKPKPKVILDDQPVIPKKPEHKKRNKNVKIDQPLKDERDRKLPIGIQMMTWTPRKPRPDTTPKRTGPPDNRIIPRKRKKFYK